MEYEWGVWSNTHNELHRSKYTEQQAREWVQQWNDDNENHGKVFKDGIFSVCRRPVGDWERLD